MRHSLWLLASAKFIVPAALVGFLAGQAGVASLPLFTTAPWRRQTSFFLPVFSEPVSLIANSYEFSVFASDAAQHNEIYCVLTGIWLTGCLTLLVAWATRRRKFLQALSLGRGLQSGREWQAFKHAQESLRMKTEVGLVISPHKTEPTVCRVWKPVVMLAESIAEHLNDEELQAIMLHELVHIQRRDNLIGNFQMTICALLWFHPLVWFISRKLYNEREQACDERVLEICAAPEVYAASILKVVRFSFGWRVAGVIGAASGTNLRRRIENIMSTNNPKRSLSAGPRLLATALVGLALVMMVVTGVYSRARGANITVAEKTESNQPVELGSQAKIAGGAKEEGKSPQLTQPPHSPQPVQAPQPAQAPDPARAPQPAQSPQLAPAPQPAQSPSTITPPLPSRAPRTEAQEKTSPKATEESGGKQKQKEVDKGRLIEAPHPVYPEEAKKQKVEGRVTVGIVIGEEGKVISARATSGPEILYDTSVAAAYKARFTPTKVNGKPAKVSGALSYNFVLDKK